MMRRMIFLCISAVMISAPALYAADAVPAVPDDDSAQFMPYPAQPPQEEQPAPQPAPRKPAPAKKKPAPKKPAPAPKPAPKKAARKPAPARKSSLQKGIELMQQERYEQAKPWLLKAIQEERNNPNAWYWYGVYHEKTGGFHQAQYFYTKAVTIDPAFEPLSRVVFYPSDPDKTPLWDPKRPARVYPVDTSTRGITQVPPNVSRFPDAPNDPEVPQVPVYTPPEPGTNPLDGDPWAPGVYVPPRPEEAVIDGEQAPVYTPPDAQGVIAEERQSLSVPMTQPVTQPEPETGLIITNRDRILRADKPLYTPPEPGQKIAQRPAQPEAPSPARKPAQAQKPAQTQGKKSATVPANRVVRQSAQKKATPAAKAPARQSRQSRQQAQRAPASQDVRPRPPAQPARPQTRQQTPQPPQAPVIQQEDRQDTQRRQNEYLPPVGQYAPDPGTVPDRPIPPVGQGNQN